MTIQKVVFSYYNKNGIRPDKPVGCLLTETFLSWNA